MHEVALVVGVTLDVVGTTGGGREVTRASEAGVGEACVHLIGLRVEDEAGGDDTLGDALRPDLKEKNHDNRNAHHVRLCIRKRHEHITLTR